MLYRRRYYFSVFIKVINKLKPAAEAEQEQLHHEAEAQDWTFSATSGPAVVEKKAVTTQVKVY